MVVSSEAEANMLGFVGFHDTWENTTHTHTHTHTHIHTCTHIYIHTNIHTHAHNHAHMHTIKYDDYLCAQLVCYTHCNTLQHTATHCNTLQHTALNS